MGTPIKFSLAVILSVIVYSSYGQVDPDFNTKFIKAGNVRTTRHQSDGKTIVVGDFSFAGSSFKNRIVRLNTDGSIDETFDTGLGANDVIYDVYIQDNGKILVCGNFTLFNEVPQKYLVRLNTDGSIDNTFNTGGSGPYWTTYRIFKRPQGLLILSSGTRYNDQPTDYLIGLTDDGLLDNTFTADLQSYFGETGTCTLGASITITPDDKLLYTDCVGRGIIRLNADGTIDETFNFPSDIIPNRSTAIQVEDGKFILAGRFSQFEGNQWVTRVARFNSDGSKDESFNVYSTNNVQLIEKTPAGQFMLVTGNNPAFLIRLNADGTVDNSFTSVNLVGPNNDNPTALSMTARPDGSIWLGGVNLHIGGNNEALFNLNMDGTPSALSLPKLGTPATIYDAVKDTDGSILVLGDFYYVNNTVQPYLARIDTNGDLVPTFTPSEFSFVSLFFRSVESPNSKIRLQSDGKIILALPGMTIAGEPGVKSMVRLSSQGIYDPTFVTGIPPYSHINILEIRHDDKILVGGDFVPNDGDNLAGNLVILEKDGANDPSFFVDPEILDFRPNAALFLPNDRILVGGDKPNEYTQPGKLIMLTQIGNLYPDFLWNRISSGLLPTSFIPKSIQLTSDGFILGGLKSGGYSPNEPDFITYLNGDGSPKNFQSSLKTLIHTTTAYQLANKAIIYGGSSSNNAQNGLRFVDLSGKQGILPFVAVTGAIQKLIPISDTRMLVLGNMRLAGEKPVASIFAYTIPATNTTQSTNLQAIVQSSSRVSLTWEFTGTEGFEVFRSSNETDGFIKIAELKVPYYVDNDAVPGSTNYYKVRSISLSGFGAFSNTASANTPSSSMPSPTYLTAAFRQPNLNNIVELTWNNSIVGSVQIQRATDLSDLSTATTFSTTSYQLKNTEAIQGQEANKNYYFRIRNVSNTDSSAYTEFVHIETGPVNLRPVYDIEAQFVGNNVLLQWKDTVKASLQYTVYRSFGSSNYLEQLATLEDTFFIDKTIRPNRQYTYAIRSSATDGNRIIYSPYSTLVTITIPNFTKGTWTAKAPMPVARYDASAFAIGTYGYVGLGYNGAYLDDFYRFDPIANEWTPIADFPGAARSNAFSFVINGIAYVGGGSSPGNNGLKDFYSFNPTTNAWTTLTDFPNDEAGNVGALRSVSFAANGKGYVTMISRTGGIMTRELWEYNPETNQWVKRLDFPGALAQDGIGIAINNIGYVGLGGVLNASLEFWAYNGLTDAWVQQPNSNFPRKGGAAVNFLGKLNIIGGDVSTSFIPSYTNQSLILDDNRYFNYDIENPITGARASAIAFTIGSKLYAGTGYNGTYLADMQELNLDYPLTPSLVSKLKATYISDTETELTWDSGPLSTSLELELSIDDDLNFVSQAILPATTSSYILSDLLPNRLYFARIRSKLYEVNGQYNTISFYTKQVPAAPTLVSAAPASSSFGITLNWADNSDNESGFEIWRSDKSYAGFTEYLKVGTTTSNAETFTDGKWLIQNKQYYYKIRAFNESGFSDLSEIVNANSPGLKPSAPTNLEIANVGLGGVELNWTVNPEESITGSLIYYSLDNESFSSQIQSNVTNALLTGLQNGVTYYIKVASRNFNTISDPSAVVEITTLEPVATSPLSLQASLVTENSIQLNWSYITPSYEDGFILQRALLQASDEIPLENDFITIDTLDMDQLNYLDETVQPINYYQYRIMAFSTGGNSAPKYTATLFSRFVPESPTQLLVSRPSDYSLLLQWTDNAVNENGFIIEQLNTSQTFVSIASVDPNTTSFTIQEISPLVNHTFRIGAFNEAGIVYTGSQTIAPIPAPGAPTQLTANRDSLTRISLHWADQSTNEKGFIIQTYDFVNDLFINIDTVAADATNFLHANLMETRIYRYRVLSYNVAGSSASGVADVLNIILSVDERNSQIDISPNPGNGLYTLRISEPTWELTISNSIGEILVMQSSKDILSNQIDISQLPDGVYLFIFNFDNTSEVKRVIKTK